MRSRLSPAVHQLALQAGGSFYPDVNTDTLDRFARLMVLRVEALILEQVSPELNEVDLQLMRTIFEIKQHFGVTE